ncbi:hypothetical protein N0V93_005124 [Gnomoniopsis smithogilvyi]|uniref:Uncharacterized protein n=1 Tax=Gnomoniopsis smithogilvyi TaxID=1191159 RepID=A0A9W9CXV0_9PEZI|nr:hypothetical protein N0V93_005124 [Gnomoniopsis smithogilvyi]
MDICAGADRETDKDRQEEEALTHDEDAAHQQHTSANEPDDEEGAPTAGPSSQQDASDAQQVRREATTKRGAEIRQDKGKRRADVAEDGSTAAAAPIADVSHVDRLGKTKDTELLMQRKGLLQVPDAWLYRVDLMTGSHKRKIILV